MLSKTTKSLALILVLLTNNAFANQAIELNKPSTLINNNLPIIPAQPNIDAKAFILIDANSLKVLAQKNAKEAFEPASLTKLMSLYVISHALQNQQIHLEDKVTISSHAWKQEGSRMFVKVGSKVSVENLIHGIIVASGNDATMALAEYTAGSENSFVDLMNSFGKSMNLQNTHFSNPTGMPNKSHISSAKDLSIIASKIINEFPEHYQWYKQKWFTFNHIKQPNRNRLLWRERTVDGMKTGHTQSAGYCLVASANQNNMRLIAVIMGAKSDKSRTNAASQLLNYGFRFYETKQLFTANQTLGEITTWKGQFAKTAFGNKQAVFITLPRGYKNNTTSKIIMQKSIFSPVIKNQLLGEMAILVNQKTAKTIPLFAMTNNPQGSKLQIILDTIKHWIYG